MSDLKPWLLVALSGCGYVILRDLWKLISRRGEESRSLVQIRKSLDTHAKNAHALQRAAISAAQARRRTYEWKRMTLRCIELILSGNTAGADEILNALKEHLAAEETIKPPRFDETSSFEGALNDDTR